MTNLIKRITLLVIAIILVTSVSYSQDNSTSTTSTSKNGSMKDMDQLKTDTPVGEKTSDGTLYGDNFNSTSNVMTLGDLMSKSSDNEGKVLVLKGNITEVCQAMGCWLILSDGTNNVRVKTNDVFFVPKNSAGQIAVVSGTFKATEISEKQAKHYNDESKNSTVKTEDIKGPQKGFEIEATGIKIISSESDPSQK